MGPRDVTPEALRDLISARPAHGLVHAMLAAGMRHTPMAALSRYEAGIIVRPPRDVQRVGGECSDDAGGQHHQQQRDTANAPSLASHGGCLVIELPGSLKAVNECLEAIRSVLPHALALINSTTGGGH